MFFMLLRFFGGISRNIVGASSFKFATGSVKIENLGGTKEILSYVGTGGCGRGRMSGWRSGMICGYGILNGT